jgi:ABC-type branched-subunit amino acid transport system ATPase component
LLAATALEVRYGANLAVRSVAMQVEPGAIGLLVRCRTASAGCLHWAAPLICALKDDGISILMIEQNALAALDVAQYAYGMNQGEFTTEGEAARLRNQDEIVSRYFGKRDRSKRTGEGKP